jgi:hypothetical protein
MNFGYRRACLHSAALHKKASGDGKLDYIDIQ